ncbi:tRNA 2-thiocytidine(32) synthetase TtcA [Candidatus Arthromitus sp. SFB-rat-Yit]|uniref:tRNA 2-thiocytidine(32) synthetase TtcA n=1 Tax=Candidatus Arthromitus sp. SFB-rat-Yit TaxID=1041504 RepID=UPI000227A05B|nr:tRNA 2-thiocytidine(32) synthetase TtcA [Candidatus Arthromitus sp. SFB-rat-Yit]BAK80735.1 PP-loop domain-containing protein [Candidatus Arthromitus sp. SFB-rat-Yit]
MNYEKDSIASHCESHLPIFEKKSVKEIEKSIIKRYRKRIWTKFTKAINDYNLVEDGDRIAIAISGGKDSLLLAKLFQELKRHGRNNFELEFITMDPGYHKHIRMLLEENCKHLEIPLKIFDSNVFTVVDKIARDYPCYMCARMRRGFLYAKAKELNCNKLALGHHFNDVIETTLLNVFYSGNFKTMLPKLKADNFKDIELIRPMYYIEEQSIITFIKNSGLMALNCACMVAAKRIGNKRYEIKDLITSMKKNYKYVDKSIFAAAQNVNMDSILGWVKDGKNVSYLDKYGE